MNATERYDLAYLQRRAMGYADAIAACTSIPAAERADAISAIAMHVVGLVAELRERPALRLPTPPSSVPLRVSLGDGRDL